MSRTPRVFYWIALIVCDGGTLWRGWLRQRATRRKVTGSIANGFIGIFHWLLSFRPHCGPGVDWGFNRYEYQVGAQGWQPCHLHVSIVSNSGSHNLFGTLQACNRPAQGLLYLPVLIAGQFGEECRSNSSLLCRRLGHYCSSNKVSSIIPSVCHTHLLSFSPCYKLRGPLRGCIAHFAVTQHTSQ